MGGEVQGDERAYDGSLAVLAPVAALSFGFFSLGGMAVLCFVVTEMRKTRATTADD